MLQIYTGEESVWWVVIRVTNEDLWFRGHAVRFACLLYLIYGYFALRHPHILGIIVMHQKYWANGCACFRSKVRLMLLSLSCIVRSTCKCSPKCAVVHWFSSVVPTEFVNVHLVGLVCTWRMDLNTFELPGEMFVLSRTSWCNIYVCAWHVSQVMKAQSSGVRCIGTLVQELKAQKDSLNAMVEANKVKTAPNFSRHTCILYTCFMAVEVDETSICRLNTYIFSATQLSVHVMNHCAFSWKTLLPDAARCRTNLVSRS